MREIIEEIKADFNTRKEVEVKKSVGQEGSVEKIGKNGGKVLPLHASGGRGGRGREKGSGNGDSDSEGKKRKRKEKEEEEGGGAAAGRVVGDDSETLSMEDRGRDSEMDLRADKVKQEAEGRTEGKTEVEADVEVEGRRAAARAALASLTFLRRLSGGRVVVVVKDERTTSQLRDYLIHGEVSDQ